LPCLALVVLLDALLWSFEGKTMSLLAETLVEEWLNRQRFFTIRGLKRGVGEIDLLAIQHGEEGRVEAWHVEVQASVRPIGYLTRLTTKTARNTGNNCLRSYISTRTSEEMHLCVQDWVSAKFLRPEKVHLRNSLWPGADWSYHLAYGILRYPKELEAFHAQGVQCHSLRDILTTLLQTEQGHFTGSAGGDFADLIAYFDNRAKQ
jgi:hypothetical protein